VSFVILEEQPQFLECVAVVAHLPGHRLTVVPSLQVQFVPGERVVAVQLVRLLGRLWVAVNRDADKVSTDRPLAIVQELASHRRPVGTPVIAQLRVVVFHEQARPGFVLVGRLHLPDDIGWPGGSGRFVCLWCGWFGDELDFFIVYVEQLVDFPVGKHALQDSAVVGVGKSDQVTGKPPVELCLTRPTAPQGRIDGPSNLVVLPTKSAVGLQVAVL
jgi:hypothetical protein